MKLGSKLECHSCGAKFYDFDKPDPACPKCGTSTSEPPEAAKEMAKKGRAKSAKKS